MLNTNKWAALEGNWQNKEFCSTDADSQDSSELNKSWDKQALKSLQP